MIVYKRDIVCIGVFLVFILQNNLCKAHDFGVEGLFYSIVTPNKSENTEKGPVTLERNKKGLCTTVVSINGVRAFNKNVILASFKKPVVLKICSEKSTESVRVKKDFQQAAEKFLGKVSFIACDIFDQINDFSENYNVIMQVMEREHVKELRLPLFLFYKDGVLHRSDQMPAVMLHGFYTKENFQNFVTRKFFAQSDIQDPQDPVQVFPNQDTHVDQGFMLDMTPTMTVPAK